MTCHWKAVICFLTKVLLVSGCDDVLDKCFRGQYGYNDVTYLPINLYFSVLEAKEPNGIDSFCSNYPQLKTCFYSNLLVCPEDDPIWMQLGATDWLNISLCSPDGRNRLEEYQECVLDGKTFSCQYNSTGLSSKLTQEQCSEYDTEYKACVKEAVASNCPSEVGQWLDSYFDFSYISQICNTGQCQVLPDCIESNPELLKQKTVCFDAYQTALLGGGLLGILSADKCRITREYAFCELTEDAKYCGMPSAVVERQKIHIDNMGNLALFSCRLDDVEFDWPHIKPGTTVGGKPCVQILTTTRSTGRNVPITPPEDSEGSDTPDSDVDRFTTTPDDISPVTDEPTLNTGMKIAIGVIVPVLVLATVIAIIFATKRPVRGQTVLNATYGISNTLENVYESIDDNDNVTHSPSSTVNVSRMAESSL